MSGDIEIVGLGIPWDKLPVGRRFRTIGRTVTEADLVAFIGTTAMVEVLFTDTTAQAGERGYEYVRLRHDGRDVESWPQAAGWTV